MVEEHRSHIIQMTVQSEEASSGLITPHLDLIVVTSGHKQGLGPMEINTPNRTVMFFETINECAHAIVP